MGGSWEGGTGEGRKETVKRMETVKRKEEGGEGEEEKRKEKQKQKEEGPSAHWEGSSAHI